MKNFIEKYSSLILLIIPFFIYSSWINLAKNLSSGDWPYLFSENIKEFEILDPPLIWLEPYYRLTAKIGVENLSLSWEVTEKLFWFLPFIVISISASLVFFNDIFKKITNRNSSTCLAVLGCLIFTTNTYILMIAGGGQMGVIMAYALAPAVLYYLFKLLEQPSLKINKNFFLAVITIFFQIMFDPRIFLLTFFIVFCYGFFLLKSSKILFPNLIIITTVLILAIALNLFWIIPGISDNESSYNEAITIEGVNYLSFAKFSNTISLLHPNWPENIFGKVYFMRFEFIVLPLIAFAFLIFNFKNNLILFFGLTALIGIFLAKGANPPFGEIYLWLTNLPAFFAFRDSTKFYLLIILAYSILIPYSLYSLINWVSGRMKNRIWFKIETGNLLNLFFYGLFIIYWFFLIRFALQGELTGTFKPREIPSEYIKLKNFIYNQNEMFTTFWIPQRQRFGFSSSLHPAIDFQEIFGTTDINRIRKEMKKQNIMDFIKSKKIKYVLIPYDSGKEIFLTDRKFSPSKKEEIEKIVDSLPWLKRVEQFKKENQLKVYEIQY